MDILPELLAFMWWKSDEEKRLYREAVEAARQAQQASQIGVARNADAPRAWNSVVNEWKDK